MIHRLVRLCFKPEFEHEFEAIFDASKNYIIEQGCISVECLKDIHAPGVYFTHSIWPSEIALETYRQTDRFKITWQKIKPNFKEKPLASSTIVLLSSKTNP